MDLGRFETCYAEYKDFVKRVAYEKLRDEDLSDDVAQDVFLSFYKNLNKVLPGLEKAWLYRCARNAAIDYIRKRYRWFEISLDPTAMNHELEQRRESMEQAELHLKDENLACRIMSELEQVNALWFEAFGLLCVNELSYEEAAKRLGVTPQVLRARVHRARTYVRNKYGREYYLEE